ncbi:T9SS type A sorting domain-containing protein [Christiangramia salexigens]|uniref:Secretion system C-terminal sorting domain-containing protein n=1 Tax=Christiangramia salexigens TaxID=1913577 RepID=A0A1L3J2M7_9FLAO|nr:T9SS type A sorting domain-containing protein [Christiangramia salexigens]APG59370.1 hypothetical protein LPB144_02635 [Christiangramia salexigens]
MKLLLLFSMIFSGFPLCAQLYISPSDKSDSYIYVRDRLVYVQNAIDLRENKNSETEASIYLRRGSQLLQGDKDFNNNTGNGKISLYQKGTSNAYDYNYWSLPVKVSNEKNTLLNDYIYDPLSNTNSRKSKLVSSHDGSSNPLHISARWIYAFSGTNYSNWGYAGNHFDLEPGEGFTMKGVNGTNDLIIEEQVINSGSSQTYDFRGLPNNGKIELAIKKDQLILVGNPYPSALNLDKFLFENTSTTGIAYFWDSKSNGNSHYLTDYEGGYGTYSPGAGAYIPAIFKKHNVETGQTGGIYQRKIAPVAQGFMVKGKTDGKIVFKNSQRIFQKESPGISSFKSAELLIPSVKLIVEIDSLFQKQLLLAFRADSTVDSDHAMDALDLNDYPSNISWFLDNTNYVINVRPKLDEELIPLSIKLEKDTDLKFSVSEFHNFNPDRLFIFDSKDQLYFNIRSGSLKMRLTAGEYPNRFFLSFIETLPPESVSDLSVPEDLKPKPKNILLNSIEIYQNNRLEQLEVRMLYESEIQDLRLYNLNGKLIFSRKFKGFQKEFYLPTGNLSTAVYIVKVNTSDNKEITKKISIKN